MGRFHATLLFLIGLALVAGSLPAAAGAAAEAVSVTVADGNLVVEGAQGDRWVIHAASLDLDEPRRLDPGDWETLFLDWFEVRWRDRVVFAHPAEIPEDGDPRAWLHDTMTYDYMAFHGFCTRRTDGRLALMFAGNLAGTANAARPPDIIFLYVDEATGDPGRDTVSRRYWTGDGCLDEARAARGLAQQALTAEEALFEGLFPQRENMDIESLTEDGHLPVHALAGDPRPAIARHFETFRGFYYPPACAGVTEDDFLTECVKAGSKLSLVLETERYAIHRLEALHHCESRGIDLLLDKKSDRWFAFYRLPPGCSKHFLFYADYLALNGDELTAEFCGDCLFWGRWDRYLVDLREFRVRRLPGEAAP
ncbi:hypothetical protein [Magnetospira sp. QH-2]|uniref:hypothetical protein n=1 Tax=Magnetospira sp. (strain QH-2) TaxID=1288970 RepID=UPI0003E810E1|nr:hypothetical protein [Magnetospira sp. QH-2]CCQ72067.1 protein of unknown function [Magnetospira sp. QH-2]